jgi:hypothetical protein
VATSHGTRSHFCLVPLHSFLQRGVFFRSSIRDLKVCDDGILMHLLCLRTLSIVLFLFGPERGNSSIDWDQLCRFHLKTETKSSLRNVVCFK